MEISRHDLEEREKWAFEAKELAFLDAVFLINYYNTFTKSWGPRPKPEDIAPKEVFGDFNEIAYKDALRKSKKLMDDNALVGMAYFEYPSATVSYEEAVKNLRDENPGFSDKSYRLAIKAGIAHMRY